MIGAEQTYPALRPFPRTRAAGASPGQAGPLAREVLARRGALLLAAALMLAQSAVALTVPWLAGELAAILLGDGGGTFVSSTPIFLLMVAAFGAQALLSAGDTFVLARTGEHMVSALRMRVFDHLQALPLGFHQERRRGDVLSMLTRDVDILSGYVTGTLVAIVPMVATLCGAWILMLRIDWALACLAGLLVPLFVVTMRLLARRIRPLSKEVGDAHAAAVTVAEENLGMLPIVKAFTREPVASRRYRQQSERVRVLSTRLHLILCALHPAAGFLAATGIIVLIWAGSASLTPAELVSFFLYGLLMTRPLSGIAATWGDTQHARAAMDRLDEVLRAQPEPYDSGARPMPPAQGAISFEDVSFRYDDRGPVLEHFDLDIGAGETVAITGKNGAGKSSLVSLLLRFFDPQAGSVRIDGNDISQISLTSLRACIGLVPQTILLVNGTIRENIAFGETDPDPQAIRAAAEAARAHEFISALPDGYETRIGEGGVKLSGGQQQRIALARALLKDPPILVLDEATSMFDPDGEEEFLTLAEDTFRGRTVILITHRTASLACADRVLHLAHGRIGPDPARGVSVDGGGS